MRLLWKIVFGLAFILPVGVGAQTSLLIDFVGTSSPLTQGFSTTSFGSSSNVGLLGNDLGKSAWSVSGNAQNSQFGYASGALSTADLNAMATQGFSLTFTLRVLQGIAPFFDAGSSTMIGGVLVGLGSKRWEIGVGLNSSGDTVVVLPNSIDAGGPGGSIRAPGASYTLVGSGSSYHTYELFYSAVTSTASLYVDGTLRLSDYAGHTSFVTNSGLAIGAVSGGQANFAFAQLASPGLAVPEPGAWALLGLGGLVLFFAQRLSAWQGGCRRCG